MADDLKRFEEAILARKPLTLPFVTSNDRRLVSSLTFSPQFVPQQQLRGGVSSNAEPGPLAQSARKAIDHGGLEDSISFRPDFKRLPSSTLEDSVKKRAKRLSHVVVKSHQLSPPLARSVCDARKSPVLATLLNPSERRFDIVISPGPFSLSLDQQQSSSSVAKFSKTSEDYKN